MRILFAVLTGILLATASSVAVVSASNDKPSPKTKPIYVYGAR